MGTEKVAGTVWRRTDREVTVQSAGLLRFLASAGAHLQSLGFAHQFQPRRYAGSVCPSAHRTHLSNRPDVPEGDNTLRQFGARAQRTAAPPGARCLFSP